MSNRTVGSIESVSTRIVFDEGNEQCSACGTAIEPGQRHKVATVRDGPGVVYHEFCTDDCIDDWRPAGD